MDNIYYNYRHKIGLLYIGEFGKYFIHIGITVSYRDAVPCRSWWLVRPSMALVEAAGRQIAVRSRRIVFPGFPVVGRVRRRP